jgi:hypothetical protein
MNIGVLIKKHDFDYPVDYYNAIVSNFINGNKADSFELYLDLDEDATKVFHNFIEDTQEGPMMMKFFLISLKNLLEMRK